MNIKFYLRLIGTSFLPLTLCLSLGCSKMNDVQKKYVGAGEITYVAKADSLIVRGGHDRVELTWLLLSDPKISGYKVYWNNRKDSVEDKVERGPGIDTVRLVLNNMNEGNYYFEVLTYDKAGNTSIVSSVSGSVYGDIYQNSLLARAYRSFGRLGDDLEVQWMDADAEFVGGRLTYIDKNGQQQNLSVASSSDTSVLKDFPIGGSFQWVSNFLPAPNALDTFYKTTTVSVPLDTTRWDGFDPVLSHLGALVGKMPNGSLSWYGSDGTGGYSAPKTAVTGWTIFDVVIDYNDFLLARESRTGKLYRYLVDAQGKFGPKHWQVGDAIWNGYDLIFANGKYIFGRDSEGVLTRYSMDDAGVLGAASQMSGLFSQYDRITAVGDFLFARSVDGKLWSIPMQDDGSVGVSKEMGDGWGQYDMITNYGNDNLMARKANGELWVFPVSSNGMIGEPKEVIISYEHL